MPVTDVDILRAISLALAPLACAREPAEATSSVSADLRSNVDFFDRMPPPAKHNVLLRLWNAMMNTLHRNVKNGKAVILPGVGTLLPGEVLSSVPVIAGGGMRGSVLFCPDAAFRCAESCAVVSPSVVLHMPPAAQYLERVCVKPKTASTAAGVSASLCEGLWAEFVRLLRATTDRGHTAVLGLSVGVVSLSRKAVRFTSKPIVQTASSPLGAALVKAGSLSLSHDGAAGSVQRETLCGHGGPLSSAVSAPTASLALPPLSLSGTAAGVSSLEKKIDRGDREGSQLSSLTVADLEARIQPRKSRKPRSTIGPGEERAAAAENESIRRERDKRALAERQSSRERAYRQRDAVRTAIVTDLLTERSRREAAVECAAEQRRASLAALQRKAQPWAATASRLQTDSAPGGLDGGPEENVFFPFNGGDKWEERQRPLREEMKEEMRTFLKNRPPPLRRAPDSQPDPIAAVSRILLQPAHALSTAR